MKVRNERPHYYTATIYRDQKRVLKEGTVSADDPLEAIDKVHELGKKVWKRVIVEVTILNPANGVVLATSKVGDAIKLLPNFENKVEDDAKAGFVPWGERVPIFLAADIGSYFTPKSFYKLTGW